MIDHERFRLLAERVVALRQEGLRYDEIVARTGARPGTVSGILARARRNSVEDHRRLLEAERERLKPERFADDPRAERPDHGRLPMRPETETLKSASSIET